MEIAEIQKLLPKFKEKNFTKIFTVAEMESSYIGYVNNIQNRKISLGIPTFDEALGMIRPSQVVTIIAGTNVGKTALAMNIIIANAKALKDKLIILFECEIDQNEIFERLVQMECGVNTFDVESAYRNTPCNVKEFTDVKFKYPNIISIVCRLSVDDIIPYCLACMELSGKEIGLIAVDYIGLVEDSKYKDEYSKVTSVMRKLKEIALHLNVPVLNLSQPSRKDLKDNVRLGLYSGKSSGEIENSSQIVITLERIKLDNINDNGELETDKKTDKLIEKGDYFFIKANIEKKKQGKYASCYLLFNTKTTVMSEYEIKENKKP